MCLWWQILDKGQIEPKGTEYVATITNNTRLQEVTRRMLSAPTDHSGTTENPTTASTASLGVSNITDGYPHVETGTPKEISEKKPDSNLLDTYSPLTADQIIQLLTIDIDGKGATNRSQVAKPSTNEHDVTTHYLNKSDKLPAEMKEKQISIKIRRDLAEVRDAKQEQFNNSDQSSTSNEKGSRFNKDLPKEETYTEDDFTLPLPEEIIQLLGMHNI